MKMTFRWFGAENDPISLAYIRQIPGIHGIVGALYDVKVGEVWPEDKISLLARQAKEAGLSFEVVESVNVHEDIKRGSGNRDLYIENYKTSIRRLSAAGVKVICYNFMPVFDWFKTDLARVLDDGSNTLYYNKKTMEGLSAEQALARVRENSNGYELPGWEMSRLAELRSLLDSYKDIDETKLLANLKYFIDAIMPVCEECDVRMGLHPDDPPWPIFGLPRIVTNRESLDRIVAINASPRHGFTLCSGSLGALKSNDIPALIRRYGAMGRIPFAHIRNLKIFDDGSFYESAHLSGDGSLDMYEIVKAYHDVGFDGYARPDHGRMIWGEAGRPGYGLFDRALGLTYINGLWEAVSKNAKRSTT